MFISRKLKRQNKSEPESELQHRPAPASEPSFGFGFDGLTKQEMEAARRKEEQAMRPRLFIKLPVSPPSLILKHLPQSPLLPFDVDLGRKPVVGTPVEELAPMVRTTSSGSSSDTVVMSSSSPSTEGARQSNLMDKLPTLGLNPHDATEHKLQDIKAGDEEHRPHRSRQG